MTMSLDIHLLNSEKIGEKIINIPVPYSKKYANLLIESLDKPNLKD